MLKTRLLRFTYLILYSVIILEMVMGVIFFIRSAFVEISIPYEVNTPEYLIIYLTSQFIKGSPLYQNICNFPYIFNPYTPIYFLISSFLAHLSNTKTYFSLLLLCRALSLTITFIIFLIIFKISRHLKYKTITCFIAGFLFLGNPLLFRFGYAARIDLLAILFSILSIYALLIQKGKSSLYISILFSLLAVYTKQQYICSFVSIAIYLFYKRRIREMLEFVVYFIGIGSVIFLWLNYTTKGCAYLNLVLAHIITFHPKTFLEILNITWIPLLPNFILIMIGIWKFKDIHPLLKIYALSSVAMAIVATMKLGSGTHYWSEVLVTSALIGSPVIQKACFGKHRNIIYALILSLLFFPYIRSSIAWARGRFATETFSSKEKLIEIAKKAKGYVLYDWSIDVLILAEKPVINTGWGNYGLLVKRGICNDSSVVSMLEKKEFGCLIIREPRWIPPNMQKAIADNFIGDKKIEEYSIYIPKY